MRKTCYSFILRMVSILLGIGAYLFLEAAILATMNVVLAILLAAAAAYGAWRSYRLTVSITAGRSPRGRGAAAHVSPVRRTARRAEEHRVPLHYPGRAA